MRLYFYSFLSKFLPLNNEELTVNDLNFILESLRYTKMKFENYDYDSYELKRERLNKVDNVTNKVRSLKKEIQTM